MPGAAQKSAAAAAALVEPHTARAAPPRADPLLCAPLNPSPFKPILNSKSKSNTQVGFFDIVALPLFQSLAAAFPGAAPLLEAVRDNYAMWKEEILAHS